MKPELKRAIENMKKYNSGNMYQECFGFEPDVEYDALVVAPGWKPTKIIRDPAYTVTALAQHSYFSGYLVEKDGLKIAWAQTASGACNVLDHIIICAEMKFRHLIFAGAVGGLTDGFDIGDFCTPEVCISGVYSSHYLDEKLPEFKPFEKIYPDKEYMREIIDLASRSGYELRTAHVFNTDSISMEYSHLDEIKGTGAELIEMETGMFYTLARLFEKPAIALLAVSDNSATGIPLLGRGEDLAQRYIYTRSVVVPDMIFKIAGQAQYTWIKGAMPDGLAVRQVYGIVFSGDGQVLIRVEDGKNKLSGGKPEENESFEETLAREYLEELNTEIEDIRYLGYLLVEENGEKYAQVRMTAGIKDMHDMRVDPAAGKMYGRKLVSMDKLKETLNYADAAGNQMLDDAICMAKAKNSKG